MNETEFYDRLYETLKYSLSSNYDIENIIEDVKRQKPNINISRLKQYKLISEIWKTVEKSRIQPYKPVGIVAAGSLGENLTQATFKSFSRAGALTGRNAYSGIPRIKELLSMSSNSKDKSMTVVFKRPVRDYELPEIMSNMIYTVIGDLVLSRRVIDSDTQDQSWYENYMHVKGEFDIPDMFMRIQFDISSLFSKKISLQTIADNIKDNLPTVEVIASPFHIGIIDIFLLGVVDEKTKLEVDIFPQIASIPLSGIKNINKIYPNFVSLISSENIDDEKKKKYNILDEELEYVNPIITLRDITKKVKKNMIKLSKSKGEYYRPNIDQLLILMKDYEPVIEDGYIIVREDIDAETLLDIKVISMTLQDKINHWFLETSGSNIYDVWKLDYIDASRTITNDIVEVFETLGLEAARKMLYDELADNGFIASPHLMLLCDDMTMFGYLNSVDKQGITLKDPSALGSMIFEKSMQTAMELVATGAEDPVAGLPSSVIVGRLAKIGSGAVEVRKDLRYVD